MKAIAYLRVSTDRQDNGIDAQRAAILRWAEYRQHEVVAWLEDPDVSGSRPLAKRKAGSVALAMLANGEADMLAVAKLDRLSRSVHDFSGILDLGRREGWGVAALDLDVDTATTNGKMLAHMLVLLAEWERDTISDRTKAGLAAVKARGVQLGRPSRQDPAVIRRIRAERRQQVPYWKIAAGLNAAQIPTPSKRADARWHANSVRLAEQRAAESVSVH